MKRITVILFSLLIALLLAGFCSCKQEVTPGNKANELDQKLIDAETISAGSILFASNAGVLGVVIPSWEKMEDGYQNIPEIELSGTKTCVSKALKAGLKNPPELKKAKSLIVMVCEGMTSELIESSVSKYGEILLNSFPVKDNTQSKFTSEDDELLVDYVRNDIYKELSGIVAFGNTATNSLRRMTTTKSNSDSIEDVCTSQFRLNPSLKFVMGEGVFDEMFNEGSSEYLNEVYKSNGKKVETLAEAIPLYKNDNVHFESGDDEHDGPVSKLYTIFESDSTLPSFGQEVAFSIAWMQAKMDEDGFCLLMSYSPSSALDEGGVQDFDEGVAVAVKYALENPDTAILICGCPVDGSEEEVCFCGLGKNLQVKDTFFDCVSSLF